MECGSSVSADKRLDFYLCYLSEAKKNRENVECACGVAYGKRMKMNVPGSGSRRSENICSILFIQQN